MNSISYLKNLNGKVCQFLGFFFSRNTDILYLLSLDKWLVWLIDYSKATLLLVRKKVNVDYNNITNENNNFLRDYLYLLNIFARPDYSPV